MLTAILLAWLTASLGLWIAANVVPGVRIASFGDAVWAGLLFGFLQWLLSYFLFAVLVIGTLGLAWLLAFITRWIVVAIIVKLTAGLSSRLSVDGFLPAVLTGFIIALTGSVLQWLV